MNSDIVHQIFKDNPTFKFSKIVLTEKAYNITNVNHRMPEFASISSIVGRLYKGGYLNKEYTNGYVYYFFKK
jgi:predicted SpoU family rRNA methylase